jgi:checkpoint serine/threonine-protein kinase
MASSDDLINFDVIEEHKENIQALPSGRSAKKLAQLFSPSALHARPSPKTPGETKSVNDNIREEYEAEVASSIESDDPLDVWERYVQWTLDAYPSAQATPDSQLRETLERATKAFVGSAQYRNDPRYLKIWLLYIRFFADAPRETYVYLSRHGVGDSLALFYEEYAAWLESAGRWSQAEEVYKMGIDREARPTQRLVRKCKEFEERRAVAEEAGDEPSSPALPTVRPALAAKVDPFGPGARPLADSQASRPNPAPAAAARPRTKLAVFSDADAPPPPALSSRPVGSKGWDSIGSLGERKKENAMEPKPWAGETLKAGGKKRTGPKLEVFKDQV